MLPRARVKEVLSHRHIGLMKEEVNMVMGMLQTDEGASIRGEGGAMIHMVTLLNCETAVAKVRYANLQVRLAAIAYHTYNKNTRYSKMYTEK